MVDFSNRPSNAEMIEYLKNTNVLKLQSAARLAGLRWKSGTPGFDKAGIIEKLSSYSTVYLPATYFALKRQETNSQTNPLLDDIAEEPAQSPITREVSDTLPPMTDAALSGVLKRLEALEGYAIGKPTAQTIAEQTVSEKLVPIAQALKDNATRVNVRLDALETRKPVQINIGEIKLPEISGQHFMFERMAKWLMLRTKDSAGNIKSRTHALLIGPVGTGKTTAAVKFAKMLKLELYAQPLTMDSFGVTGFISPTGEVIETEFSRAWKQGGVLLWDELSMSLPDAVGALNSALANGFIALPGVGNIKAHPDFYLIAGDNSDTGASAQFSARSLLDGATLDRFVRLEWPIDPSLETSLANGASSWLAAVRAIRAMIADRGIEHVGATPRAVITGSQALQAGCFSRLEILEDTCKKGILIQSWPQVLNLPAVQTFLKGN